MAGKPLPDPVAHLSDIDRTAPLVVFEILTMLATALVDDPDPRFATVGKAILQGLNIAAPSDRDDG